MRIVPLRSRAVALAASSLLTTPFLIAYLTSPADAANPSTTCVATACTYTQSGQSLFQVPTGVSLLRVTAVSAISTSTSKTAASRIAQQVTGNVDVPNGVTELEIIVGEPGSTRAETSAIETSTAGSTEVLLAAAPSAPGAAGHAHRDHQDDLSTRSHAVVPPGGVETPATAPEKVSVSWSLPTDPVTFTSPTTGSLSVGAHTTETITAAGPTAAALAESGSLPPGTIFKDNGNSTAAITGTPLRAGTYPVSITAQAAADSPSVTQWLILTVGETPTITGPSTDTLVVGQAGSFTLTANGTPTPSLAEQGVLPAGVRFEDNGDGTATVSGAPSQAGSYPITVIATSTPGGVATMHLTLETQAADHTSTTTSAPSTATAPSTTTVPSTATSHAATPTATVTSPSAATFLLGAASTFTVTTSGVPAPQISESGALPGGVTFADRGNGTALISGTPAQVGSFPVTITVSGTGANTTQNLDISVDQSPTFTSPTSATMTTGRPTSFTVTSAGTPVARLSENGALPGGVIFKDNGDGTATISGTPTTAGMFSLTITADNNSGTNTTQTLTVTVEQIPAITSAAASTFTYGQTGSFIVTARGTPTPTIGEVGVRRSRGRHCNHQRYTDPNGHLPPDRHGAERGRKLRTTDVPASR